WQHDGSCQQQAERQDGGVGGQGGGAVGAAPDPDQSRTVTFKPACLRQCTRQRGVAQAGRWRRRLQGRTSVTDCRQPYHTGWAGLYPGPGSRLGALQQPSQKLGPLQPAGDQEVLAVGVRTTAVWTQTVEGRDAEGRREVPVAAAPGAGFLQPEADPVGR